MKQEEKQRKFHEALLKMLYPPPPPPSPPHQEEDGEENLKNLIDPLYHLPGELEGEKRNSSSSSSDDNEVENCGPEKLTRAQRKRFRKKKFKEAAAQRRKIIGPLLPGSKNDGNDGSVDVVGNTQESVRQNATSDHYTVTDYTGEPGSSSKQNKIKQRRKSKKLSGKTLTSSNIENITSQQKSSQ